MRQEGTFLLRSQWYPSSVALMKYYPLAQLSTKKLNSAYECKKQDFVVGLLLKLT